MEPAEILKEAADWLVRADTDGLDEASERALAEWRRQSPDHERAWQAACKLRSMLGDVPPELGLETLLSRYPND